MNFRPSRGAERSERDGRSL